MLKRYKTLFLVFSLSLLSSCKHGPKVDVCISAPEDGGAYCVDKNNQNSYFLRYDETDNFVMFSPNDARKILEYCTNKESNK